MIMTHADINFYSPSDKAEFELDLDEENADHNPSLFIRHIHGSGEGSMVNGRHFLTIEQLRTLRDLLNEKLPPNSTGKVKMEVAAWEASVTANPPQRVI